MSPATRAGAVRGLILAGALGCAACVPPPRVEEPVAPSAPLSALDLSPPAADSLLRKAREVTVRIRALGCDRLGVGSGFVLSDGVVVTNRHVVDAPREVTLNTWDGRSLDADVSAVAVDSDLAVLTLVVEADLPAAELRAAPAEVGEPVVAVGYPGGGPATISTGEVVRVTDGEVFGQPAGVIVVDASIRPGNSGGPLLDDEGRVVGVVFALEANTGLGLAVPASTLVDRLDSMALAPPTGAC